MDKKGGVIFVCVVMMKERVISAGLLYRPQVDRRRKGEHPEKKTKKKKKKIAVGEFFFYRGGTPPMYIVARPVSLHLILLLFDRFVV